jgi:hypothetical protein
MKTKGKEVWLARDDRGYLSMYNIVTRKGPPKKDNFGMYGGVYTLCADRFQRITGFKLKRGECRRVRIKIEEVT